MHLRFLYMEEYQHLLTCYQRIASPKVLGVLELFELLKPRELFLGGGNGTPLQYSCLENPMDGGAW